MVTELPGMASLLQVMRRLRDPESGCPWDREQDFKTIAPYTIEEAYEVADAIERGDMVDLKEELGDLLFQSVFHARIAEEAGLFDFDQVAQAMTDKLIRRHPHVFGEGDNRTAEAQNLAWEEQKATERQGKNRDGVLDDVPVGFPALLRAVKLTKRAARVGFDWSHLSDVFAKLEEEIIELKAEIPHGDIERIEDELGDVLFVIANLARKLDIDPEAALRRTNAKFTRRFAYIESNLRAEHQPIETAGLERMETLWLKAKHAERASANDTEPAK